MWPSHLACRIARICLLLRCPAVNALLALFHCRLPASCSRISRTCVVLASCQQCCFVDAFGELGVCLMLCLRSAFSIEARV